MTKQARRAFVALADIQRRRVLLVTAGLILAGSAAADEFYVPLSSGSDPRFVTEVRIVNRSESRVTVAIETFAPFAWAGKSGRSTLGTGEVIEWSDIVMEHGVSDRVDALAIRTDGPVLVTAIRRCADCGAMSNVPALAAQDAIQDGAITAGTTNKEWKSGVGVINPGAADALLTVSLQRQEHVIDEASVYVRGRAAAVVSIDDLFSGSATDPNDQVSFSASQSVLVYGYASNERSGAKWFAPVAPTATAPSRRRAVRQGPPPPSLQTVVLTPSKDNTLYQTANGSLSNGAGIHLFAGMTNRSERRRALLAFDVSSQIPPGSQITSVALKLQISQTASGPEPMELHRVSADWGEGSSNAGPSQDGDGAGSRPGDATWIHTFFSNRFWTSQGGDFDAAVDATALAGDGPVNWGSSAAMVTRVQDWLDRPSTNFGWIVLGNEANTRTAKRFDSREIVPSDTRPSLTITFKK